MTRRIRYDEWSGGDAWAAGTHRGTAVAGGSLVLANAGTERGEWDSPRLGAGFAFADLVASWSARTPPATWIEVAAITETGAAHSLGVWSSGPEPERRSSQASGQESGGDREVDVDTWRPVGGATGYALRVTLCRRPGAASPSVRSVGAVVSGGEVRTGTSRPRPPRSRRTHVLDVPPTSALRHQGAGGEGWCSPTAVSMVLAHAGRLPPGADIPIAAAETYDPAYAGTGNWSFNVAWAATLVDRAFVTRLHDLREAETYLEAGIPLLASVAYPDGDLTGAPVAGTDGHLLVLCGFTSDGDVVVNDPAGASDTEVRRTYRRAELERAWLHGSGGVVYVIANDPAVAPGQDS